MAIIGPEDLITNVRGIHDDFIDKLRDKHKSERAKIDKLLSLEKLRRSIEGLLDKQIQKAAKGALKAHLAQIEKGETLDPFLSIETDIERLASAAWDKSPSGLQREYSAKDLGWGMAVLLENAGYFVQADGKLAIDIPLTDDAAQSMLDDDDDDVIDDEDPELTPPDEDSDQELQIPEDDEEGDSGESNE